MWPFSSRKYKQALFLHIQKTAGSSIIKLVRPFFGKKNIISHGDYVGRKPEDLKDIPFVSGHFGYDFAKDLMTSRYSFTFLRDPAERILSFYYFWRRLAGSPIGRLKLYWSKNKSKIYQDAVLFDLDQFLQAGFEDPLIKTRIWNNQVWQLAHGYSHLDNRGINGFDPNELLNLAIAHLDEFSHVGFTETFEEDQIIVLGALGIPLPEENVIANSNKERPSAKEISPKALELLNELTHLDRILYDEAWSRREKRTARVGPL